jgi:hypothetical protein
MFGAAAGRRRVGVRGTTAGRSVYHAAGWAPGEEKGDLAARPPGQRESCTSIHTSCSAAP